MAGPSNDGRRHPARAPLAELTPANLRVRRVALGLTQAGLADLLGVTANTAARTAAARSSACSSACTAAARSSV